MAETGLIVSGKMSEARGLRRSTGARSFLCAVAVVVMSICALGPSAWAQLPFVPDDWKFGKRQESNTLHYCVDARDPDLPVARKIGEAIAGALLLEPREHAVGD